MNWTSLSNCQHRLPFSSSFSKPIRVLLSLLLMTLKLMRRIYQEKLWTHSFQDVPSKLCEANNEGGSHQGRFHSKAIRQSCWCLQRTQQSLWRLVETVWWLHRGRCGSHCHACLWLLCQASLKRIHTEPSTQALWAETMLGCRGPVASCTLWWQHWGKLPMVTRMPLYRGMRSKVKMGKDHYHEGNTIAWPALSSTSQDTKATKAFLAKGSNSGKGNRGTAHHWGWLGAMTFGPTCCSRESTNRMNRDVLRRNERRGRKEEDEKRVLWKNLIDNEFHWKKADNSSWSSKANKKERTWSSAYRSSGKWMWTGWQQHQQMN